MLVLVTRPAPQAAETAARLTLLGHAAIISPVINIVPTGAQWPAIAVDRLIATSARAFEALHVQPDLPSPEARRLIPLSVVGKKTLAAARAAGFAGSAAVAPDVQHFAAALNAPPHSRRALYLAGRERKPEIETICAAAALNVTIVETYGAEPAKQLSDAARAALDAGAIGAVLHYSRRSTAMFLELLEADGFDASALTHLAISEDAAGPLRALDLLHVHVAARPDEDALLALLVRETA